MPPATPAGYHRDPLRGRRAVDQRFDDGGGDRSPVDSASKLPFNRRREGGHLRRVGRRHQVDAHAQDHQLIGAADRDAFGQTGQPACGDRPANRWATSRRAPVRSPDECPPARPGLPPASVAGGSSPSPGARPATGRGRRRPVIPTGDRDGRGLPICASAITTGNDTNGSTGSAAATSIVEVTDSCQWILRPSSGRRACSADSDAASSAGIMSGGFEFEAEIGGWSGVRERADRHVLRAGRGQLGNALERDAAGDLDLSATGHARHGFADVVGREVVEQDARRAAGDRGVELRRASPLRLRPARPRTPIARPAPSRGRRRPRAACGCP